METVDLDLSKDARNEFIILQISSDKIEELHTRRSVAIGDDPDSERCLNIISNFKRSQFGNIFSVIPSTSEERYINVKNHFCTTVALHRQDLGLPEKFWFTDPFYLGGPLEQQYVQAAKREKEEQEADSRDSNLKPPSTTGTNILTTRQSEAGTSHAETNLLKPPSTTGRDGTTESQRVSTTSSANQMVITPSTSTTLTKVRTSVVALANNALEDSYTYQYYSNYGNFPTTKFRQAGPYLQLVYTNQPGYSHLLESKDRK